MKWFILLIFFLFAEATWAMPLDLKYGVNEIDINADGLKDMVVKVRWDNLNAHSFDRYLVMVRLPRRDYPEEIYEVPLGDKGPDYAFTTEEGADCLRVGYNFELDTQGLLTVTRYAADAGQTSYCEPQPVTVTNYTVTEGLPDMVAPYYLKEVKQSRILTKHGDVRSFMK